MGNKNKEQSQQLKKLGCRRWGHRFLAIAVLLTFVHGAITLHTSVLEDELAGTRRDENYFITNSTALNAEIKEFNRLQESLSQMQVLRKLARVSLTKNDAAVLKQNEASVAGRIEGQRLALLGMAYVLSSTETPKSTTDLLAQFRPLSNAAKEEKLEQFHESAKVYALNLKDRMVALSAEIAYWNRWTIILLAVNGMLILVGQLCLYFYEEANSASSG